MSSNPSGSSRKISFSQPLDKKSSFHGTRIFLSKPQAWHIIAARSAVHIISPCGAVYHARARSPFARWHSVLRSVFDGTLAEQSARGSLVQARTHSRLIITHQRAFPCGLMIYNGTPLMIYRNKLRMIYKAYALIISQKYDSLLPKKSEAIEMYPKGQFY